MLKYYIMNEKELNCLILEVLKHKFSCAQEIMQVLAEKKLNFEMQKFYPTLSQLQLKNYLCTNWLKNNQGQNVKYYHITKNGYNYIHK